VAVGLVVLEHASDLLPGGYIGVDVFFVISGFVITRLLLNEFQTTGRISLSEFYNRRVRRLIPALTVVVVSTLVLSSVILSPGLEQNKAAWTALSSIFFVANIRYALEGGYFFLDADPFRHLWSLAVEEQFYLVFPLALIAVFRAAKKFQVSCPKLLAVVMGAVLVISLIASELFAKGVQVPLSTRLSFFGTPFRLWELVVGGLVAVAIDGRSFLIRLPIRVFGQFIAWTAILVPATTYGPFTIFPGFSAVPPVAGAALLILLGTSRNDDGNILKSRPLMFLGDISYGLYLWHWPLIVFANRLFPQTSIAPALAVVVAIVVSERQLTWLENPFRREAHSTAKRPVWLFFLSAIGVSVGCAALLAGSQWGYGINKSEQFERLPTAANDCTLRDGENIRPDICRQERQSDVRVLLIGDSQAAALSEAVLTVAEEIGASYEILYGNSCPLHARPNEIRPDCGLIQEEFASLISSFRPTVVLVANASDLYVTRGGFGKPDAQIRRADGSLPSNYEEALDNWLDGVVEAIESVSSSRTPVIYVQMVPVAAVHSDSVLSRSSKVRPFALSEGFDRNSIITAEKEALSDFANITLFDPASVLCPGDKCALFQEGRPIYADRYHLNTRGALLLSPSLRDLVLSLTNE